MLVVRATSTSDYSTAKYQIGHPHIFVLRGMLAKKETNQGDSQYSREHCYKFENIREKDVRGILR